MHHSNSSQKNKKDKVCFNRAFSKTVNCRNNVKDSSEVNCSRRAYKSSSELCYRVAFILVCCTDVVEISALEINDTILKREYHCISGFCVLSLEDSECTTKA